MALGTPATPLPWARHGGKAAAKAAAAAAEELPMISPIHLRQTVPTDEGGGMGLMSIPTPPRTPPMMGSSLYAPHDAADGGSDGGLTPTGRLSKTRSLVVTPSKTSRPGSAPPRLAIYHQQRPTSPPPVASLRPDSAPPVRPNADMLRDVREIGVGRSAAPHTFGTTSAINMTSMPPPPAIDNSKGCCPWVGPRVISGERFKFDLALRRRCCFCEGICNGFLLRRRLVQFSWGWRHYTGAALWRRGKGPWVQTLVFLALVANLVALIATRSAAVQQQVAGFDSGWSVVYPPLQLSLSAVWVWLEWGSAAVLVLEVLLQWTAHSFLPWFMDVRHLFRLLLAGVATLTLLHPHVALRAARPLVLIRIADMVPMPWLKALNESFFVASGQFMRITVALGLLLGLLTLVSMQLFGGVLRGRCLPVDAATAYGWGVPPEPEPVVVITGVVEPAHCLNNWRVWTTLGVLELPILVLFFGTIQQHVRDMHRRSSKTRWRRSCAGGGAAAFLQVVLALAGWVWFRNLCETPESLPRHCLDNWRVWAVLAALECALLAVLAVAVVRKRRADGKPGVATTAARTFSAVLQPVLAFGGFVHFRGLCEARMATPPIRPTIERCFDNPPVWSVLIVGQLSVLALLFAVLWKREKRLARCKEERKEASWVTTALGLFGVFLLQAGVLTGGTFWFVNLCAFPEVAASSSGSWSESGSWDVDDDVRWSASLTLGADIAEVNNGTDWFPAVFARDMAALLCQPVSNCGVTPDGIVIDRITAGSIVVDFTVITVADDFAVYTATATGFAALRTAVDAGAVTIGSYAVTALTEVAASYVAFEFEPCPSGSFARVAATATAPPVCAESASESASDSWDGGSSGRRLLQEEDGSGSGSWGGAPWGLASAYSAQLCDPYPTDLVNRCPAGLACVDMVALTGARNGQSTPSFDGFFEAAVATGYIALAPGWTNFYEMVTVATSGSFTAGVFGSACAVVGALIVVNVQLATVKTPVSAAISRIAIAQKRSELAMLRRRVLGKDGHLAARRACIKTPVLELMVSCCGKVAPRPLKRLRNWLRGIAHDPRYRAWMVGCSIVNTLVIASAYSGMPATERSVSNALLFYFNCMFLVESALKVLDISPDPFATDQYRRGPATSFLGSFDSIDLIAAVCVFSVPSGSDPNVPLSALNSLRCLRLIWYLATAWLPSSLIPLRTATAVLIQCIFPLVTIWVILIFFGFGFVLLGQELLPTDGFETVYSSVFILLQTMNIEELPTTLDALMAKRTEKGSPELLAFCYFMGWAMLANGFVFNLVTAALADVGERQRQQEPKRACAVVSPAEEEGGLPRPTSAGSQRPAGMILKVDDVFKMVAAFGQDTGKVQVERFFTRVCEVGQPLRLPQLLAQLEVDAAISEDHVTRAPTVHFVRNMLRFVRVLAIVDIIVEVWLWLGVRCLRSGAPFDCWVPLGPTSPSPTAATTDPFAFLTSGMMEFPGTEADTLLLCFVRSLVVTYAATRPRRLFGVTGIFMDAQVGYYVFKSWQASEMETVLDNSDGFWWMVFIGMGVTIVYRVCSCAFVYTDSLHAVAPRGSSAVETIVSNDRVVDLVAAVRFFSLCDSAGKGHVTEVELRRVLRALNGGARGTNDIRFDAGFLARDLMHQMDSAVDGKVYLDEFLRHASSGKNTPLTRLLLSKQMVRVLTAFTVADVSGERLLERSQLGRFMSGTGLHMSEDDLDETFLQVELDHSGRVDLFELLGFLTATRELPHLDAVPPAWASSPSKGGADPVQILKIHHEEEDVQYPEPMRPKVTFAVPLDPRHVRVEQDEDDELLPTLTRGTRPFFRPYSATPEQKPKPDLRWRPNTAPSAVLGASTYNLSLSEWQRDLRDDGGRQELIESAMRQIYDKCDHNPQKALNLFAEIDVDGSGEIDHDEFEQFIRRLGVYLNEQQVQWLIAELDRDGGGDISSAEFMALVFKDKGSLSAMVDGALEKIFEQLGGNHAKPKAAKIFREIDKDDSGELSYEEFADALKLLGVTLSIAQLDGVIASLDQDGDGGISLKEFIDGVFGAKHASKNHELEVGNSFMRVTVLEAKLKHPTDVLKYCLANLGGFPEGSNDIQMGVAKQTGLSEIRPLDMGPRAKDKFLRNPKWKINERTKKPKGFTSVFEPEWTPASLEVQCYGRVSGGKGEGVTNEDTKIGGGNMDLDGLKKLLEWQKGEWVPLLDDNKKYAGRVRVKVTWHPYIPPFVEKEPEAEALEQKYTLMVRIKEGVGFTGEIGENPVLFAPYCIAVINDKPAKQVMRQKSSILPVDRSRDQLFWTGSSESGTEDLWFHLAGIPEHIELRLMHRTHDEDEEDSNEPDRTLGHGFLYPHELVKPGDELPTDKILSKDAEVTFTRQVGEGQGTECGTVSLQVVWDPTQREKEVLSDDEEWPTRRLRATVLGVRDLPEPEEEEEETSLFCSFITESLGKDVEKVTGQSVPSKQTERDFPKNTAVDFAARRVPKELQVILMDDTGVELGSCVVTGLLVDMPKEERWSKKEWITLAEAGGRECELHVQFNWETEPALVPDLPRILRVTVFSGRQLAKAERYGENDPYVTVTVNGKTHRTDTVASGGSMPAFADGKGETFDWEVSDLKRAAKIKIVCYDDDGVTSKDDVIGAGIIELSAKAWTQLKPPWSKPVWTTLKDKGGRGRSAGDIHTLVQYWDPTHHEEPPPMPLRRLRVTVLSGSKLPRMDLFGENDPYVLLNVEGVKKRTATLDGAGASPIWGHGLGERFEFFCIDMPLMFKMQAYDEDVGSADDLIGTVEYTIDSHDPEEIWTEDVWIDLKNDGGKDAGLIHCLLRWSPDPTNDPGADKPGKRMVVTVMSAMRLPKSDVIGKNDPYVIVAADDDEQRTPVVEGGGANVEWDEPHGIRLEFPFVDGQMAKKLSFRVMDEDIGSADDEIGSCHFSLMDHGLGEHCWDREESMYLTVVDRNGKTKKSRATLTVKIAVEEEIVEVVEEVVVVDKPIERRLEVTIINAEHLPSMDMFSENDVYCTVQIGADILRTSRIDDGGADPFWHGGSGETLYITKKVPPQVLDLKVWDCDEDEPANYLTATIFGAQNLPKPDLFGKNDPYANIIVDGQIQRTPTIEDAGADVEWGAVLRWQLDALPDKVDVMVMDADAGSKDDEICRAEFEFIDTKMGRGMIPGVTPDANWEKEWAVQCYKKDGKSIFRAKKQPKIRVLFKWEPNVIDDDFIGGAKVPLGSSLPADQEWSVERDTSIFTEKGAPAGTVHVRVRWNIDPASEPMMLYGENDNSPQSKKKKPEPEPEPEPEPNVLSSGKPGAIPASIAHAQRATLKSNRSRNGLNRSGVPKDDLGFELETREPAAMKADRQPAPREVGTAAYSDLMTYIEAVDVNGIPAQPRQIRPTSAAMTAPIVHTEIIVDDDAQAVNPAVVVLAAIESVVTIASEESGTPDPNNAAVPWRSLTKVGPALSLIRSRVRAAQRWHIVQMYGSDADAIELHRKRHGLTLMEVVKKQRKQYRESLSPYQFTKPASDWPSLVGGGASLLCRLLAVGELTSTILIYLTMLCLGSDSPFNCWATTGGHMNEMAKPPWDSYGGGGIGGTITDTLVLCAVRTGCVLYGPSNPYSIRVAGVACCVGIFFGLIKMIAHMANPDPPTHLHTSMFLLGLLIPIFQLGLLYATYFAAKMWSIKLRTALSTDPLQEERERVQALADHSHYKFERFPVWCGVVTMDPRFEVATVFVVAVSSLVVTVRGQNLSEAIDKPLSTLFSCCVIFFCIELVLKAVTFGLFTSPGRHDYTVDGALMPTPLLHTGRGVIDTGVVLVAVGHLLMQALEQKGVVVDDGNPADPMAPALLMVRMLTVWWLPHLRGRSVRVRGATVVVQAWRRLLGIAAVLFILTSIFAMVFTAEFGGSLHRCVRGGGFVDTRAVGVDGKLFGTAGACEQAALGWVGGSHDAAAAPSSGSGSWEDSPAPAVCAWVPLRRASIGNATICESTSSGHRWRNDIINFDGFWQSVVTLTLASHQGWFRLGVMLMQSAGSEFRQSDTTVLLPPNVAVDESWPPREPRTAVYFLLLGCTLHILLARLWLAVIWNETDRWERLESVKANGRLPYQTERRAIRQRVGTRLAQVLRMPELEDDLESSESEEEEVYSSMDESSEEEGPDPSMNHAVRPDSPEGFPAFDGTDRSTAEGDDDVEEEVEPRESRLKKIRAALSCGRCKKDSGDKYAMNGSSRGSSRGELSLSKADASSSMVLPADPPKQHDRRFIRELSKYSKLYTRVSGLGVVEGVDAQLEQLMYAFDDEELRLLMRMNQLLVFEYVRDPKTGAYTMEEKPKPHKIAYLHSNLHKLRPAGELRKSATGSFFERWPEVRPSTAEAKAQKMSTVRGAEMAAPRLCCHSQCLMRWLRGVTTGAALAETGLLCLVQWGRDGAWEQLASFGGFLVTLLLLADTGMLAVRRVLCCQWKLAARATVSLLVPAVAFIDLLMQYMAASAVEAAAVDQRAYVPSIVELPSPRTAVVALVLLQIGHQLSAPGFNPNAGIYGLPRRIGDTIIAQVKALQTTFDATFAGVVAALPVVLFAACIVLGYASLGTRLYGHLWVADGEAATAVSLLDPAAPSDDTLGVGQSPVVTRFGTSAEALSTLSSLALGAPAMQLYSGLVWASCDGSLRLERPEDCSVGWVAAYLLSFLFAARVMLLGVASVFVHRYRAVRGAATAAEEALRHVDVWCEAWHKLLLEGSVAFSYHPMLDTSMLDETRNSGRCGIGCCASAASAPALLGTTLPVGSLVELLLSVPAPLGCAGATDPTTAVREILLGMEGLELRTVEEDAHEDDENGNAGGGEALEFGSVLLAAVERAARCNADAVGRSAAYSQAGRGALRQAFAVFFHDMVREKTFKDEREFRDARTKRKEDAADESRRQVRQSGRGFGDVMSGALARTTSGGILRPSSRDSLGSSSGVRPMSGLKRPGSATVGRPGSAIGAVHVRPMSGTSFHPAGGILKRPGSGRPGSGASSRPTSAASSRGSDSGAPRPHTATATMRPGSAGLGRLRPLSAQQRAVSAGAKRKAGDPRRVLVSDLTA